MWSNELLKSDGGSKMGCRDCQVKVGDRGGEADYQIDYHRRMGFVCHSGCEPECE